MKLPAHLARRPVFRRAARFACRCLLSLLLLAGSAYASSFTILHTNDLHDYIKPSAEGLGGMPYLSGYVNSIREQQPHHLILDAGDVMEKGDMLSFVTKSRVMYEALGRIGYHAGAIGNHDIAYGVDHLRACEAMASGMRLLCLNFDDESGAPLFPSSHIFHVGDARVAVIGLTIPKGGVFLSPAECGKRLDETARSLKQEVDLIIALGHIGSKECLALAAQAPDVRIFIGGHTHETLREPVRSPETGAWIVQAGFYAQYVGRIDLELDPGTRAIRLVDTSVVALDHSSTPVDTAMLEWVIAQEREHCPDASVIVGVTDKALGESEVARLAAAALRDYGDSHIGLCHPGRVMRSGLPQGNISVNHLFRTGGQRGCDLVQVSLSGAQIEAYLSALVKEKKGRTEWSGFRGAISHDRDANTWIIKTDLSPDTLYDVIMPETEWTMRLQRVTRELPAFSSAPATEPAPLSFTFTEALAAYVKKASEFGDAIDDHVSRLTESLRL